MIGGPLYLRGIERDLERRVPEELASRGIDGIDASFSGQEGVLRCVAPLPDPESVLDLAHGVDGVALVTLDRSCRVSGAPVVPPPGSDTTTTEGPTDPPATDEPSAPGDDPDPDVGADPDVPLVTGFESVDELVASTPRLSLFAALVAESGVSLRTLADTGPITVFAPVDSAFDELPADVLAELRTRPDLIAEVIRAHVVEGAIEVASLRELADDPVAVTALSGEALDLDGRADAFRVDGARIVDADLLAADGVVHAIDRVLLPPGLDLRALDGLPELVAVLRVGTLDVAGSVPTQGDALRLIAAANRALAPENVEHDLATDPSSQITEAQVGALVALVELTPTLLTTGSVGFDGAVFVRGVAVDEAARAELSSAAGTEAAVELSLRPTATDEDRAALQDELAEVLADRPIRFAPNTADLTDDAAATLDVLAAVAKRFAGTTIVVEGHTDTAGDPQVNLDLSELRAAVVVLELALRGVPPEQLDLVGRGGAAPILVDGVEDADASRRVELLVDPGL